jgi:hypothetical protein
MNSHATKRPSHYRRRGHWRSFLPWRVGRFGTTHVDPFVTEELLFALCGSERSSMSDTLKALVSERLADGRMVLRAFEVGMAPWRRVRSASVSTRAAQRARKMLLPYAYGRTGRGSGLPFRAVIFSARRSPLQHGALKVSRGFSMASIARVHSVSSWRRPVPLVLGSSTPTATWKHLRSRARSIAVWPDGSTRLWILRQLEGRFPTPLGAHKERSGSATLQGHRALANGAEVAAQPVERSLSARASRSHSTDPGVGPRSASGATGNGRT